VGGWVDLFMWADSNAAVLSFSNAIFGYLSLLLFVFIIFLILIQYLRNRKNKPMSKIIAGG
jgi:type II secretory pathway component PulF